jgi:glycosyltransferase involved in cell wall biosynthesis
MVSTTSLMNQLRGRGFRNLSMWTRGVDADLFVPDRVILLDLPRPIFLTAGRLAVEKNLEAFLSLDLPGSKVVIGEGPQEAELRQRFRDVTFLGLRKGPELAGLMAAADVFVFPSRTDTFGVVQLEALACGIPVAAFPVMGPRDVIGGNAVGVLDEDLRAACLGALTLSREACRNFALTRSWTTSAREFIANVSRALYQPREIRAAASIPASARG